MMTMKMIRFSVQLNPCVSSCLHYNIVSWNDRSIILHILFDCHLCQFYLYSKKSAKFFRSYICKTNSHSKCLKGVVDTKYDFYGEGKASKNVIIILESVLINLQFKY